MRRFEVVNGFKTGNVTIPQRKTKLSAGYDIASLYSEVINPGETKILSTGLKAYMNRSEVLQLFIRSSIGIKRHCMLANCTGIIDADYADNPDNEGHILVALYNYGKETITIEAGETIVQGIFMKYQKTDDDIPGGKRIGGIGSTGAK